MENFNYQRYDTGILAASCSATNISLTTTNSNNSSSGGSGSGGGGGLDRYHYRNPGNNHYQSSNKWINATGAMHTFEYFDYVCVIDFEATCIQTGALDFPHEIIEFPIVLINMKTKKIEDCFQQYVRPVINPRLSNYCVNLTGITQEHVDNADTFPEVLQKVKEWFKLKQLGTKYRFAIATDGPWDFEKFLNLQCYYSNILYPFWASRWIDVRQMFSDWFGLRRCNIERMLEKFGFEFEGKQHCGLDDARNIARIFLNLVELGCPISFNGQIRKCRTVIEKYPYSTQFNGFIDS